MAAALSGISRLETDVSALSSNNSSEELTGSCCGRVFTFLQNGYTAVADTVNQVFEHFVHASSAHQEDPNMLSGVCKKLELHVLTFIEHLTNAPHSYAKVKTVFQLARDTIDVLQLAADADYFISGKFLKDSKLYITGRVSILCANLAGTTAWLGSIGMFNLSKVSQTMGSVRVFSWIPSVTSSIPVIRDISAVQNTAKTIGNMRVFNPLTKVSLGFVAERALGVAYLFFAADAAQRWVKAKNENEKSDGWNKAKNECQKKSAALDFVAYSGEAVLSGMMIAGVTSVVGLGILGSTCLGLNVSSFIYKLYHKKELEVKA